MNTLESLKIELDAHKKVIQSIESGENQAKVLLPVIQRRVACIEAEIAKENYDIN